MKILERFIDYCRYETTSDKNSTTIPSTIGQTILAKHLVEELKSVGVSDAFMDEYSYVYGSIPANSKGKAIGLIAHMDTSDAVSGKNVEPRVIENYDGKTVILNKDISLDINRFKELPTYKGKTLIVTNGETLLGADDKAGIAIIMEVCEYYQKHPEVKHGLIRICFTPDEEIGRGPDKFNYEIFKVDFAYTLDGGYPNEIEYENFNAAAAEVKIKGLSTHPGTAKDCMINAASIAIEFDNLLPVSLRPEYTCGYEGFNHLCDLQASCEEAIMHYIIRNHDINKLNQQKALFEDITSFLNKKYPRDTVKLTIRDQYRNMREKFINHEEPLQLVERAMNEIGLKYTPVPIRGGTDGATITYNGILCPNIGTGGHNCHGKYEYAILEEMIDLYHLCLKMLEMVIE